MAPSCTAESWRHRRVHCARQTDVYFDALKSAIMFPQFESRTEGVTAEIHSVRYEMDSSLTIHQIRQIWKRFISVPIHRSLFFFFFFLSHFSKQRKCTKYRVWNLGRLKRIFMREEKVARDADNENIIRVVWKRWSRAIGSICVELRNFARISLRSTRDTIFFYKISSYYYQI